ncbi:hypothetical protein CF319_g4642 [Tilletia indica]|nr:hypothetical protein CF319_g4642 [Tilletia indica]
MASFLIIGAGVFGASTALHLKKHFPHASVTILERSQQTSPAPDAASSDLNKIIRADYADDAFRRLAVEAIAQWRTDERLRPFYHEVGLLLHSLPYPSKSAGSGLDAAWATARKGVEGAERVAKEDQQHAMSRGGPSEDRLPPLAHLCKTQADLNNAIPQEARGSLGDGLKAIGGQLDPATIDTPATSNGALEASTAAAYCNPRAGWAEAKEATCAVLAHAVELGVRIESGAEVVELLTVEDVDGGHGRSLVRGVKTADGRQFEIDPSSGAVFLCGGSWTPSLLQSLIPSSPTSIVSPPPVVFSAQTVLIVEIPEDVALRHANIPVVLNFDTGFYSFEPRRMIVNGEDGIGAPRWLVKCAIHDRGYQAPLPPSSSGSAPHHPYPAFDSAFANGDAQTRSELASTSARKYIPTDHEERMLRALRSVWPEIADEGKVYQSRICWYAETTDENWLIDTHPSCSNLIVASGDSGHGFKFLPTIGALIAARLPDSIRPTTLPPLDEHWSRVFSWAHHLERFHATRTKHMQGEPVRWAEWKPDRDSASKVVGLDGGHDEGQDVSRGL